MAASGARAEGLARLGQMRLASGLILMSFALMHFLNHALGLHSVALMERARGLLAFWHSPLGWPVLALAIVVHAGTSLLGIHRKRSLRLPLWQWLQILSGLAIPFLLVLHYLGTRGVEIAYGKSTGYPYVLWATWPDHAPRQAAALVLVWLHGCIGLHYWLRLRGWYRRLQPILLGLAVLIPTLSLAGLLAGMREAAALATQPGLIEAMASTGNWPTSPEIVAFVATSERRAILGLLLLLLALLVGHAIRQRIEERGRGYAVDYGGGRRIRAPLGLSLLEASRLAHIPHAAVCGGRGRCSTCRVRVTRGLDRLPPPEPAEQRVLDRLGATPDIRLACQLRPRADLAVQLLVPATVSAGNTLRPMNPGQGVEREIAVLFADLRHFTKLSEGRLPFDVVHLLNRYFQTMGAAIEAEGGHVDKFIGDGIMALFGIKESPREAARAALRAVAAMQHGLDRLNREFAAELGQKLRMVVGLHFGHAIVGDMGYGSAIGLTAIGDTVNVASRLEAVAKEHGVALAVSAGLLAGAGLDHADTAMRSIAIRGRDEPLAILLVERAAIPSLAENATAQKEEG